MKRGLLLVPLLAIVLAVWAFTSDDALDLDPIASAATLTSDAGSARVAFETSMKLHGREVTLEGDGAFDFEDSRGVMTLDAGPLLPTGSADSRFELRMLGSMIYMRIPTSLSFLGLPDAKPWVSFDVEKTLKAAGLSLPQTSLQQDPIQTLRLLRALSTSVTKAGTADVRGTPTTRYKARLDLRKAIEASGDDLGLSSEAQEALHRAAEQLMAQSKVKMLPVEVFVDKAGLLRRMKMKIGSTTDAASFALTQTTDYYDFGVEVAVKAPPKSQVFDLSQLAG